MPEQLTRSAPVGASTLDRPARTVVATLTTGAPVKRHGPRPDGTWGAWIERLDLRSVDTAALVGAPVLRDHEARIENIVGRIEAAGLERDAIVGRIKFDDGPAGDRLLDQIAGGFVRALSIGYEVGTWERGK